MAIALKLSGNKQLIWDRLLAKSSVDGDCLLWTGGTTGPYGMISISRKSYIVHRVAYWIHNTNYDSIADIPKTNADGVPMMIRHLCPHKLCFKPEHLAIGSQYENDYDDKLRDGTLRTGNSHYNSSITLEIARQIKDSRKPRNHEGYRTQKQRASDFNVSLTVVKSIDRGVSWMELQSEEAKTNRRNVSRNLRKAAKTRQWTDDMWEEARQRLLSRSMLSSTTNEFVGTPCRLWTAGGTSSGYAQITIYGRLFQAHRLACAIKSKAHYSPNMAARHLCGNSLCVREDHLEFGTAQENGIDRARHGTVGKVSSDQVIEIRENYESNPKPYTEIAKAYGVHAATISQIIRRLTWTHL
jgi:hypothetical protein